MLDFRRGDLSEAPALVSPWVQRTTDGQLAVLRPPNRWQSSYVHRCLLADATAAVVAASVAYLARWGTEWSSVTLWLVLLFPPAWIVLVLVNRGYEPRFLGVGSEEFRRVGWSAVALTAVFTFAAYLLNYRPPRGFVLVALPLIGLLSLAGRYALRRWLHHRRGKGEFMHRVVLVGHEEPVLDLARRLSQEVYHGLQVVAACVPGLEQRQMLLNPDLPVVGGVGSVARAVRLTGADTVAVLASADLGPEQLRRVAWELEPTGAELLVAPSLVEVAGPRLSIRPVSGLPLLQVEQPSFTGGRRFFKNAFDRLFSLVSLLVLSPLLLVIAAAIKVDTRGPAIFRQERVGRDGAAFTLYKFRSMVPEAEDLRDGLAERSDRDGLMFKMFRDPRVTRVGAVLRRYSLDELPQLWNVLRGQMSLVGPRPPLEEEVAQYPDDVRRRLLVLPGMTGLWQVSGRADLSWEESVRLDLRYVDNWSFALDLLILWKTIRAVLTGNGAY
jgi:exopolysaccharide biosynthesis polyprenyl glycosylphosphotransferase